jgi:hypothetical protein
LKSLGTLAALLAIAAAASSAKAVDLHDYWDKSCASCHNHAAAFARRFLTVKDGKLQGRNHVDNLEVFLGNHYLRRDLFVPVTEMLAAQATTEPRFRNEYGRCHEAAAALARERWRCATAC